MASTPRLDEVMLDYLYLDASFFRMHPGSPAEPVLAAWGITTDGKPAFTGLAPGTGESADAWHDFLTDLKDRGLASPLLVISDGAPGLIAAIEQACPQALRQRCIIHRARNILAKIPAGMQAEVKDAWWAIFDTEHLKTPPGPGLVQLIDARIDAFAERYRGTYPAAVKILLTDREGLTAYLRFPAGHHHRIRHSNFIERTFGETRRRVKVIGRLPGETSCLTLARAVPGRVSRGWRGVNTTPAGCGYCTTCAAPCSNPRPGCARPPPPRPPEPAMPSRNDNRNDTSVPCPACGQPFTPAGRRRWCSGACRQAAWRRRHPGPQPAPGGLPAPRPAREHTVYECPDCSARYTGRQRCDDCRTFCRRIGPGGPCPHCDEAVAISDLTAVSA